MISVVTEGELPELLPLMRGYCDFYRVTLSASRIGVMNDLFVTPGARGRRIGAELIAACLERCREHGATTLGWQTALDNTRAQSLYDRVGGQRERWLDYSLPV
jgi:ribosomal protein S18 acetylase RimI-like enzyme